MFGLLRRLLLQPLFETPAEGSGGGDWPEYDVPAEVGQPEGQPAQPAAAAPPAAQPPATQPGGQPGRETGQPAQPGGRTGRQPLPAYREEQIASRQALQTRLDQMETENKRFRTALADALGLQSGTPAQDPRAVRLRETLFNLVPELKNLVEKLAPKSEQILGLTENADTWKDQNQNYWRGVAVRTIDTINDGVAKVLLGEGKTGKDLDPEMLDDIKDGFIRWCERDKTGARVQRYEAQEPALVREYLQGFVSRYVDPVRRSAAVAVTTRGQAIARLPQSGGGGNPVAAAPPKVDNNDSEAVHKRAWDVLQQLRS